MVDEHTEFVIETSYIRGILYSLHNIYFVSSCNLMVNYHTVGFLLETPRNGFYPLISDQSISTNY